MTCYKFFFSYARANRDNCYIEKLFGEGDRLNLIDELFQDLCDRVHDNIGGDKGLIGYRDIEHLKPGMPWPESLANALRSSSVLVPLLTPNYFQSQNCGREFQVFLKRHELLVKQIPEHVHTFRIVPIYWISEDLCWPHIANRVKPYFKNVQQTEGNVSDKYPGAIGYRDARETMRHQDWTRICIAAARRIVELKMEPELPILEGSKDFNALPSAFTLEKAEQKRVDAALGRIDMTGAPQAPKTGEALPNLPVPAGDGP